MKLDTDVYGGDAPAAVNFRTDLATIAPPVGHFSFRRDIYCPSNIVKMIQRILMKLDTEVCGWDALAPVDFQTDLATLAPPVGHFSFQQGSISIAVHSWAHVNALRCSC